MKIERTKNASRNIIFGIILKAYQILIPFLMRTAMIYFMGVQYLGLNSVYIYSTSLKSYRVRCRQCYGLQYV